MNASRHTLHKLLHKFTRSELSSDDVASLRLALNETQAKDWQALLSQAELYGISNWLLKHCTEQGLAVPKSVLLSLKALSMRHRAAANARYQLMQALIEKLAEHNVPLVALKGLALAPMIYPSDELRPMRDLDVLVPRDKEALAAKLIREMGFHLPESQPSRFMRNSHQLPNATKSVNGFNISLEIHHDALSRDVHGNLFYEDLLPTLQTVKWRDIEFKTLGHEQMLHQVCRHLQALHPGAVLKLINVMDVVLYCEQYDDEIDWLCLIKEYSHVINTLKCLHSIMPLSEKLQQRIAWPKKGDHSDGKVIGRMSGIGETMVSPKNIISSQNSRPEQLKLLFSPSDWWLHLYYNVDPRNTLFLVKTVRHPTTILVWLAQRLYSRLLGG
ncbi:MAG: hypothetical protein ACI8XV_003000 [Arenicella sp.]|jgi:hypothetical protein